MGLQPDDRALELLRVLVVEVRGLRADLAAARGTADPADARLLLAIIDGVGDRPIRASDVSNAAKLKASLSAALLGADVENPKQLGIRLGHLEANPIDGVVVERVRKRSKTQVWRVRRTVSGVLRAKTPRARG
jgi:hypothetical protein